MENRGGYAYGIWLKLTPLDFIPFNVNHPLHITLMSNIGCKRTASKIFSLLLKEKENLGIPELIDSNNLITEKYIGSPLSAIAWTVNIPNWSELKECLNEIYPSGNIPDIPHISLKYYLSKEFEFCDYFCKNVKFKVDLVLADMNDSNPENWKCGLIQ